MPVWQTEVDFQRSKKSEVSASEQLLFSFGQFTADKLLIDPSGFLSLII